MVRDPEGADLLASLDPEQRTAAEAVRGPVCILAGAGTGKTRAITYRIANLVATGVAAPDQVMAVTFTTRAAGEMRTRLRGLGVAGAQARTFHSAALRQLQYFWPRLSKGPRPTIVESKLPSVRAAAARVRIAVDPALQRDLAAEIEWAKAAQVSPDSYAASVAKAGRVPPLEARSVQKLYAAYEDVNSERGQFDFEDLLVMAAFAIEEHREIAVEVRGRYRHFVVDEYQDVNPLQQRLLDAWLGERDDLCVVGDPHQTIYSFTGATPSYLLDFPKRYADATVVKLVRDYRSTAQVVGFANRLMPDAKLAAQAGDGPEPTVASYDDEPAEAAAVARRVAALAGEGVPLREMAVLYRVNAQSEVYEAALAAASIPYVLRGGERFFDRTEVREAVIRLRGAAKAANPPDGALPEVVTELLGLPAEPPGGRVARERWESLRALVGLAEEMPDADLAGFVEELARRAEAQHAPPVEGVTLASLHAAKGLEWDAVFLVGLTDGTLPITHATTPAQIEEERRLLYVGITRARRHLSLSWAASRAAAKDGRQSRRSRKRSRFLDAIVPAAAAARPTAATKSAPVNPELFERLREWRLDRSREEGVPAYVVFDNKTLEEIAARRPADRAALAAVPGVGPKKLEQYADDVLEIVAR